MANLDLKSHLQAYTNVFGKLDRDTELNREYP